jgi:very-short-patch-repair endonuclease
LDGLKFKRQVRLGRYVVDFACAEHHLVVAVDGSQHADPRNAQRDAARTSELEAMGYLVLRFWSNDVLENPNGVATVILDQLERVDPVRPHPDPLPSRDRESGRAPSLTERRNARR